MTHCYPLRTIACAKKNATARCGSLGLRSVRVGGVAWLAPQRASVLGEGMQAICHGVEWRLGRLPGLRCPSTGRMPEVLHDVRAGDEDPTCCRSGTCSASQPAVG